MTHAWTPTPFIKLLFELASGKLIHQNLSNLSTERYAWELTSLVPWFFASFCAVQTGEEPGNKARKRLERGYTVMPVDVIPHNRMGLSRNTWYGWCTPIYSCSSSGNILLISEHGISKIVVYPNWSYDHSLPAYSQDWVWTYQYTRLIFISKRHQHRARVETEPWEESDYKLSKRTSLTGLGELASHTCYERVWSHCNWREVTKECCIVQHFGITYWHALNKTCSLLYNKSDWSGQYFSMHIVTTRWLQCNLTVKSVVCKTSWWFISLHVHLYLLLHGLLSVILCIIS